MAIDSIRRRGRNEFRQSFDVAFLRADCGRGVAAAEAWASFGNPVLCGRALAGEDGGAAGAARGGYDEIADAAKEMGGTDEKKYAPVAENSAIYDRLYAEYEILHDYFGRGENNVMKRLKAIKEEQRG